MRLFTLATSALLAFASAANAQYVGVTDTAFDGGQGLFTYNRACHAAHPGSRMCTSEEIVNTVNPPIVGSPGELAWVKPARQPFGDSTGAIDASGSVSSMGEATCDGWSTDNGSGYLVKLDDGTFTQLGCHVTSRVACCIPVPEPSASLTIPSGAATLFALAKLRGTSLIR